MQYRLPTTGELVPLLQIAPSKTDTERLLVVSPDMADVLSAIISRLRSHGRGGAVPLVPAYDSLERTWLPPSPALFQRRFGSENRRISGGAARDMLNAALAGTGLAAVDGGPLRCTPHDFRRIFITDAKIGGVASDATFPERRERALPALQGLEPARRGGPGRRRGAGDLRCDRLVASAQTMMHPDLRHPATA